MKILWYSILQALGVLSLMSCIILIIGEANAVGWWPQSNYYPWIYLLWASGAGFTFKNGYEGVQRL